MLTGYHTTAARACLDSLTKAVTSSDSSAIDATLARYNQRTFPVRAKYLRQDHVIVCTTLENYGHFVHDLEGIFALPTDLFSLCARGLGAEFILINVNPDNFIAVLRMLHTCPMQLGLELTCSLLGLAYPPFRGTLIPH